LAALGVSVWLAPLASAHIFAFPGVSFDDIAVGQTATNPAVLGIGNDSTLPEAAAEPVLTIWEIDLHAACTSSFQDCRGGTSVAESGVYALSATGTGVSTPPGHPSTWPPPPYNSTCEGTWTIVPDTGNPATATRYRFIPPGGEGTLQLRAEVNVDGIANGETCNVRFSITALRVPTNDVNPGEAGVQTHQVASSTAIRPSLGPPGHRFGGANQATVAPARPALTTSATPSAEAAQPISDTATVAGVTGVPAPTGTVTFNAYGPDDASCAGPPAFTSGPQPLAGGPPPTVDSGPFTPTTAGTYRWVASYSGDANYSGASGTCNDANEASVVTPTAVPTTTTVTTNPAVAFSPSSREVTLTAQVLPDVNTGAVTFSVQGGAVGPDVTAPVDESGVATATFTLNPGVPPATYGVVATYNGTPAFEASSGTGTLTVEQAPQTVVFTSTIPADAIIGGSYTATATAGASGNPVAFSLGGSSTPGACTVTSTGQVAFTGVGTCVISATQAGNTDYLPAPEAQQTITVARAAPAISTQASPGTVMGGPVRDVATLTGGVSPTGTVTFRLFSDASCLTEVFSSTNPLTGATATSGDFFPTAPGTYRWAAVYNGDANNDPVTSPCNAPNESVTVTRAQPSVVTRASSGSQVTATEPSASITDTATVSGGFNPTGTVTFRLYGPNDAACAGTPMFSDTRPVAGNADYTSAPFTTTVLGAYRWVVDYSGDANNNPATSPCDVPDETSVVAPVCAAPPPPGTLPGNTIVIAGPGLVTIGTPGDDVIYGTAGDDRIDGGGGNDVIFGQGGHDEINGGDGLDTVCGGDGDDDLVGGAGGDLISGDAGDDVLFGGQGVDTCVPGTGPPDPTADCRTGASQLTADFDGDLDTDVSLFRPSSGTWFVHDGPTVAWGTAGDLPVPGDYDGDGTTDIAVFRPSSGTWFVEGGPTVAWGTNGDLPVPGDYDGDGTTDTAVFRPSSGTWFVEGGPSVAWGTAGDIPVPGDYDGDGTTDTAVFRPSTGAWFIEGGPTIFFGTIADQPLPLPSAIGSSFP
jgi:hypothetical protein